MIGSGREALKRQMVRFGWCSVGREVLCMFICWFIYVGECVCMLASVSLISECVCVLAS